MEREEKNLIKNSGYRSPSDDNRHVRPNERTVRFLVKIIDWIKDIISSTGATRPQGQVIELRGKKLPPGKAIRFTKILLVEDNPDVAADFIETLRHYYMFGGVMLYVAYGYDAALTFFNTADISMVIMDADLDDEQGDGVGLTQCFTEQKQDVTILANSSSALSNMKLTGSGAMEVLGKDPKRLRLWLQTNDPFGAGY